MIIILIEFLIGIVMILIELYCCDIDCDGYDFN